jgi:hypothetical protein
MTVDVSLLLGDDFCESAARRLTAQQGRKWIASIASAARQVHGPAGDAVF